MPEAILRNFRLTDPDMIQDARTKHASFLEDQADFEAFDADFTDAFADDFLADIDAAEAMDDDETVLDQQQQLTNAVLVEMDKCREKFQDSKFFIEKAFPNDAAIQNEFGFNDYKKAQDNQAVFTKFMLKFHGIATKYSAQLIAKNYTQPKIDEILACYEDLRDADIAQELFIKNHPVKTQERIVKMNKVWQGEQTICAAGKRIYKDDYAKYQRYLLPPGEEAPEVFSISGTVTNSSTASPEENVTVSIEALGISTITDSLGRFGFGALPAGTYEVKLTKPTLQDKTIPDVVVSDGNTTTVDVVMDPA